MRSIRHWALVPGTLLLALAAALPAAAQTSFVTGHVRTSTGVGIQGMVVSAYSLSGAEIASEVTSSDGSYTLALSSATYKLLAYDRDGAFATSFYRDASSFETSAEVGVPPGSTIQNIDFRLEKGYFVSGTVRVPAGISLSDVVVAAYNLNGSRRGYQKVSPTGTYSLVLPAGTYKFAAYDERQILATQFFDDALSFGGALTVQVTSNLPLDFSLQLGGRISGTITNRKTGGPLENVWVFVYDLAGTVVVSAVTDSSGRYSVAVPAGTYKLGGVDPEKRFVPGFLGNVSTFESSPTVTAVAGQQLNGLSFSLEENTPEPVITTLFIPVAASNAGSGGTFFRTDVWIQNPHSSLLEVEATHLPPPSSGQSPLAKVFLVQARSQRHLRDIVATEFGRSGGGALKLTATSGFVATSRTYNDPADPSVGTSGLSIAAQPATETLAKAIIPGLSNSPKYRSNVGAFNPGPNPIEIRFSLYDENGLLIGEGSRLFAPLEWFQANTIFAFLGVSTNGSENAYLILSSKEGSFFSYGTVVDGKSGDSTLILPSPSEDGETDG
ncbi:MAG: carboxypeptidase-like regulatory domain-containing protein [Acidobacteria bacterium]|nr:carboxypeptidase-like regulatory domain-containing protein [Acidobacteriota bacterium]